MTHPENPERPQPTPINKSASKEQRITVLRNHLNNFWWIYAIWGAIGCGAIATYLTNN